MSIHFNRTVFILMSVLSFCALGREMGKGASAGVIGRFDRVEIRVFREDDLATRGRLAGDGSIRMPLIGAVKLLGLSTEEAATAIAAKLRDGYLVDPQVSVSIEGRVRRSVTVLGQAQNPGVFELEEHRPFTVVEAIGMAGGATRIANTRRITLKRVGRKVLSFDLNDITSGKIPDIPLMDGDVLSIPESLF